MNNDEKLPRPERPISAAPDIIMWKEKIDQYIMELEVYKGKLKEYKGGLVSGKAAIPEDFPKLPRPPFEIRGLPDLAEYASVFVNKKKYTKPAVVETNGVAVEKGDDQP